MRKIGRHIASYIKDRNITGLDATTGEALHWRSSCIARVVESGKAVVHGFNLAAKEEYNLQFILKEERTVFPGGDDHANRIFRNWSIDTNYLKYVKGMSCIYIYTQ